MDLKINVICENLPGTAFSDGDGGVGVTRTAVHLGIQRGGEVVAAVPADRKRVIFEPVFRVAEQASGTTNFLGPYAKGTPAERFFYLSWVERRESGELAMFRRAKVHLSHLPWSAVASAAGSGLPVSVRLSLTDERGGPRCGSIREADAHWQV